MTVLPYHIDLLGKPFEYGARGPDAFDCYGLACELYRRSGLQLPDYESSDQPEAQGSSFIDGANRYLTPVADKQPLDLILFQIVPRYVSHCGVYLGHGRFIHVMHKIRVAVEELASPVWEKRIRGIYRFTGERV